MPLDGAGSANVILYVGLCMVALGLTITFLGLGEKGFKTLELRLIGPSLVGCGMFFTLLRIFFCAAPSCCRCGSKKEDMEKLIEDEHEELEKRAISSGRTTMRRNGLLRPMRHTLTNERRGPGSQGFGPPEFSSDDEEDVQKTSRVKKSNRSQRKPTRRISRQRQEDGESTDSSSSTFSLADLGEFGPELFPRPPNLGGSTKDIRNGEIIMNTNKL